MENNNPVEPKYEFQQSRSHVVGIDLGTTFSVVGVWKHTANRIEILANDEGSRLTPSIVSYVFDDGKEEPAEILVGPAAKRRQLQDFTNTIYDAKRLIGRAFDDKTVESYLKRDVWEFQIDCDEQNRPAYKIGNKHVLPMEISTRVLERLKLYAELGLNDEVHEVVITHPAYFDQAQKQETIEAAYQAGFKRVYPISEPVAAAYAYGFDNRHIDGINLLVFDFGGGTFDVSIIWVKEGEFHVKNVDGNSTLGGRDFDQILFDYCSETIKNRFGKNLIKDKRRASRVKQKCEEIKKALSTTLRESLYVGEFYPEFDGVDGAELIITRKIFEDHCEKLIQKTVKITRRVVADAGLCSGDIAQVLLVGGSSRIPMVRDLLYREFGTRLNQTIHPEEAVAYGAAVRAAQLAGIPEVPKMIHFEVIPLSLGVETNDGRFLGVIPRNTSVPFQADEKFFTSENDQREMTYAIYEGESQISANNRYLGQVILSDLEPGPAGGVETKLTLRLDENGVLHATAVHKKMAMGGVVYESTADMKIDYGNRRASDRVVGEMLRKTEMSRLEDAKNFERKDAASKLDLLIKKTYYNIENSTASKEAKAKWIIAISPIRKWFEKCSPTATVREFDSKSKSLNGIRRSRKIPTRCKPTTAEPTRVSSRGLSHIGIEVSEAVEAAEAAEVEVDSSDEGSVQFLTTITPPRRSSRKHSNTTLFIFPPHQAKRRYDEASNSANYENAAGPSSSNATVAPTSESTHVQ